MSKKYSIFITSNEPWGEIWFSKHHYASELANHGNDVYFLNPQKKWRISNLFSFKIAITEIDNGLKVVDYKNNFPTLNSWFLYLNDFTNCWKLKKKIKTNHQVIWWLFDPVRFVNTFFRRGNLRIYHVVDPYMRISTDIKMANKADLVVCTSSNYIDYYTSKLKKNAKILHVPHGVSRLQRQIDEEKIDAIKEDLGDFMIMTGSISDDIDFDLIKKVVQKNRLILIGPLKIKSKRNKNLWKSLEKNSNFLYLGVKHASELRFFIGASKAGLLLYLFDLQTKKAIGAGSPLKVLNYISQNKVVISTIDTEIYQLKGCGIFEATNANEYLNYLNKLNQNELFFDIKKTSDFLDELEYSLLISRILSALLT